MPKGFKKTYKVRRYRNMYSPYQSPTSVALRTVLTVVVISALGFIGWNAYAPISDYFSGALAAASRQSAAIVSSSESPSQPAVDESPAVEELPPSPVEIRAIYLPTSVLLSDHELDEKIKLLINTDINALMFDLKDSAGTILYRSGQSQVELAGVQTSTPYDLRALCEKLAQNNLTAIGRMHTFSDSLASAHIANTGVKYMNTKMLWLDNAPEQGGKPWLNPYSNAAQTYLQEIAAEVVSMGVKHILLDSVSFPTGFGQEFANFGEYTAVSRIDTLSKFVKLLQKTVEDNGGTLHTYVSGIGALGATDKYYGGNPIDITGENVTIGIMPSQFGDSYTFNEFTINAPLIEPYNTVNTLLKTIAPNLSEKNTTALIQCYTATGSLTNNKVYTTEDVFAQIRALAEHNITSYILYSPRGSYPEGLTTKIAPTD